jgi:acyl-CoA thioester hydrolase
MFEVKLQARWSDSDAAGMVHFANHFTFVEQAEEALFRAHGLNLFELLERHKVWMPRVEAFSKYVRPIKIGVPFRVRLNPKLKGLKTIRYEFEIVEDLTSEKMAEGYVTVVCVDAARLKATPIPDDIRSAIDAK